MKEKLIDFVYQLQIFDAVDLVKKIAKKEDGSLSRKELKLIVRQIGEKDRWPEVAQLLEMLE